MHSESRTSYQHCLRKMNLCCQLVKGTAAPKRSNLLHYLRTRQHMKIHIPSLLGKCEKRRNRFCSPFLSARDAETLRREERVQTCNPHTGTVSRGMADPNRKNPEKDLVHSADMKVYTPGESTRSKCRERIALKRDTPRLHDIKDEESNIEASVCI